MTQTLRTQGPERALVSGFGLHGGLVELTSDLLNRRVQIANFGRRQVNEELDRQKEPTNG